MKLDVALGTTSTGALESVERLARHLAARNADEPALLAILEGIATAADDELRRRLRVTQPPADVILVPDEDTDPDEAWRAFELIAATVRQRNFLWQPSTAAGEPETLLGRPIYENPALSNGSAAKAVFFGDFSRFYVARMPVRVEASIHAY